MASRKGMETRPTASDVRSGHHPHGLDVIGPLRNPKAPSNYPPRPRRRDHGADPVKCAYCNGYGDICNPGNANPSVKVVDWLYPVNCPRCNGTGKEPNHG